MRKIINRPQVLFVSLAVIMLISSLINKGSSIQVAMYSTYVDLDIWITGVFSAVFFILIAVNYTSLTITRKKPRVSLTVTHIVLQLMAIFPLLYFFFTADRVRSFDQISQMNLILIFAFALFIIATVVHLINFVVGLLSKKE